MNRAIGLIRASHPEPAVAVTLGVALLALVVGSSARGVVLVAATILASQLCTGWSNDWLDAGRDSTVGRTDKPIATGAISRRAVGIAGLVAGVACVAIGSLTGWPAVGVVVLGLVSALTYNWPLKSTPLSLLPYLVSFGALAAFPVLALPGSPTPPWWLVCGAALLGGGAHFANVLPDLADDARTGIRGLPHRLGARGSWLAAAALLLAATAILVLGPPGSPSVAGWAIFVATIVVLPIGWYLSRRPGSRAAFRAVLIIAVADAALLVISGPSITG